MSGEICVSCTALEGFRDFSPVEPISLFCRARHLSGDRFDQNVPIDPQMLRCLCRAERSGYVTF